MLGKTRRLRFLALILFLFFTAVLFYGSFSGGIFSFKSLDETEPPPPFSLSGSQASARDCIITNGSRHAIENRPGREIFLATPPLRPALKELLHHAHPLNWHVYLLEFLSIVLFMLILIFWTHQKDGKKRDFFAETSVIFSY